MGLSLLIRKVDPLIPHKGLTKMDRIGSRTALCILHASETLILTSWQVTWYIFPKSTCYMVYEELLQMLTTNSKFKDQNGGIGIRLTYSVHRI